VSYNLLRINDEEAVNDNIDFTLESCVEGALINGGGIKRSGEKWISAGAGEALPLTMAYSEVPTGNTYSATAYAYNSSYWAYTWAGTSYLVNTYGCTRVQATKPPGLVSGNTNWHMCITVPAGTYLVQATPSFRGFGSAECRLYHTATNNTDGVYFGNHAYIDSTDGKTGNIVCGVMTTTTTRRIFIRLTYINNARLAYYFNARNFTWQIRKLA